MNVTNVVWTKIDPEEWRSEIGRVVGNRTDSFWFYPTKENLKLDDGKGYFAYSGPHSNATSAMRTGERMVREAEARS